MKPSVTAWMRRLELFLAETGGWPGRTNEGFASCLRPLEKRFPIQRRPAGPRPKEKAGTLFNHPKLFFSRAWIFPRDALAPGALEPLPTVRVICSSFTARATTGFYAMTAWCRSVRSQHHCLSGLAPRRRQRGAFPKTGNAVHRLSFIVHRPMLTCLVFSYIVCGHVRSESPRPSSVL